MKLPDFYSFFLRPVPPASRQDGKGVIKTFKV
jgi:hypothetical protein